MDAPANPETLSRRPPLVGEADLSALTAPKNGSEPAGVADGRRRALARLSALGLPAPRDEAWRYTDLSRLRDMRFEVAPAPAVPLPEAAVAPHRIPGTHELVFVDGHFAPALSRPSALPNGTRASALSAALAELGQPVTERLGARVTAHDEPFVALSEALWRDGAYIHVSRNTRVEAPIHVLHVMTAPDAPRLACPRHVLTLEAGAEATVVETYVGSSAQGLLCPLVEITLAANASLDHYKVEQEDTAATHLAALFAHQARDSRLRSHSITTGGGVVRNDVRAVLSDEGIDCILNGLYIVTGRQSVDNAMRVEHEAPHCTSHELYRGILDGHARAAFTGRIYVHEGAQKTDAVQNNRNLLLSRDALAQSNPQLEIFADDVRCTHGSTVGQLDEDAIFYLRSRGIGEEAARSLLTYAFASDIIGGLRLEPVRRDLEEFLFERLPRGEVVRQAV